MDRNNPQLMALSTLVNCNNLIVYIHIPESFVLKVSTAGGPVPYSFMACTDQLYCVLCWRLVRRWEVEVM